MKDWIKAGEITAKAREYGVKLIKVGASHREVTEKIEKKIEELGGKTAFPVQMSVNGTAAHYTALLNKDLKFKEGDLVKLDLGVHINGAIGDSAVTVDLGDNSKLVKASQNALKAALDIVKPGVKIREIGRVIHEEITSLNFSPIRNLGGHGLSKWEIHSSPSIPNFDNGDSTKLGKGQVIAIEPFASNGDGLVIEGNPSEIYNLVQEKNIRNQAGRNILRSIKEEYKTLPFAKRFLLSKFNKLQLTTGLLALKREGILHEYPILVERRKDSMVSQAEHTIIVGEQITTKK
jgi:methionyl aminopeptidase